MFEKMIDSSDIVYFEESDFCDTGKPVLFVESGPGELVLPNVDIKSLFVRIVCREDEALSRIQSLGQNLAERFPGAKIMWAFGVGKEERVQILGV